MSIPRAIAAIWAVIFFVVGGIFVFHLGGIFAIFGLPILLLGFMSAKDVFGASEKELFDKMDPDK